MTHYCDRAYTTGGDGPEDVRPGSFAEYVLTGANTLFHKPASLSFCSSDRTLSGAWKADPDVEMKVGDDVVVIRTGVHWYVLPDGHKAAGRVNLIAVEIW